MAELITRKHPIIHHMLRTNLAAYPMNRLIPKNNFFTTDQLEFYFAQYKNQIRTDIQAYFEQNNQLKQNFKKRAQEKHKIKLISQLILTDYIFHQNSQLESENMLEIAHKITENILNSKINISNKKSYLSHNKNNLTAYFSAVIITDKAKFLNSKIINNFEKINKNKLIHHNSHSRLEISFGSQKKIINFDYLLLEKILARAVENIYKIREYN